MSRAAVSSGGCVLIPALAVHSRCGSTDPAARRRREYWADVVSATRLRARVDLEPVVAIRAVAGASGHHRRGPGRDRRRSLRASGGLGGRRRQRGARARGTPWHVRVLGTVTGARALAAPPRRPDRDHWQRGTEPVANRR